MVMLSSNEAAEEIEEIPGSLKRLWREAYD